MEAEDINFDCVRLLALALCYRQQQPAAGRVGGRVGGGGAGGGGGVERFAYRSTGGRNK